MSNRVNGNDTGELFEDFPIKFKEINPQDFKCMLDSNGDIVETGVFDIENNGEKIIISPNEEGYINDEIQSNVDITHKNTVVVNAAVGQGKSYAIIQTIKRYYDAMQSGGQKYLIFVASPFVSLVKQYCNDIEKVGIAPSSIYSYDNIGREDINYLDRPIQVITANTLLGNPGEDAVKNSDKKRKYLNALINKCKKDNIKVVFIYDEIHDSYKNFRQKYILNLWKWKEVIHKNFVLSATYNEASKVVIKYLAELTDCKIKIIESERKRFPEKQSDLYLHYSDDINFNTNTIEINTLIKQKIEENKNIDILCYSKRLAENIIDKKGELGKLLYDTFGEVKNCTSELDNNIREVNAAPQNQYDNTKCNVGTNFKTGVSIKKENHAFIIIMPPRSTRMGFKNMYGIFSDGVNAVIQALARQRKKGEIHIVLSKPDEFDYSSLRDLNMTSEQKEYFTAFYNSVTYYKEADKKVGYINTNNQTELLMDFYENTLKEDVKDALRALGSSQPRLGLPKLSYPTYEEFVLENGEEYLSDTVPIFGGDISAYVTYAAITNQFSNCTHSLYNTNFKRSIILEKGKIKQGLSRVYSGDLAIDHFNKFYEKVNFKYYYMELKEFFNQYDLKLKRLDGKIEKIKPNNFSGKLYEIQMLHFVKQLWSKGAVGIEDGEYSRGEYFLDCISIAKEINAEELEDRNYKKRVKLYQLINYFREKIISKLQHYTVGSNDCHIIPARLFEGFYDDEDDGKINEIISSISSDDLLDEGVFEFKRRFENNSTMENKKKTFYKMLIQDFLNIDESIESKPVKINNKRTNCKVVSSIPYPLPNRDFNTMEDSEMVFTDDYIEYKVRADVSTLENLKKSIE